jgi:hypothetical protein
LLGRRGAAFSTLPPLSFSVVEQPVHEPDAPAFPRSTSSEFASRSLFGCG